MEAEKGYIDKVEKNLFAGVIVNQKTNALNRIFHYQIPSELDIQLGMVVRVSFARQTLEAIVVELTETVDFPAEKIKPLLGVVSPKPLFGWDLLELAKYISNYYLANRVSVLQGMLPAGMHLTGKMPKANIRRRVYAKVLVLPELRGGKQRDLLAYVLQHNGQLLDIILKETGCSLAVLRALEQKNLVELREEVYWGDNEAPALAQKPVLSAGQQAAIAKLDAHFAAEPQTPRPALLYGVTGSGKTELYLDQVEKVLNNGKQVILLVPEIALTPQTVRVFQGRLGARVAVLHSNLTGSERRKAWQGIAEGKYDVVIGARSAVFAPTPNLGLIILDEEHETSYKQDNVPRFHTRQVAVARCRLTGARLLLGSATPDLESYYQAEQGNYLLVTLPERIGQRELAPISIVDMREELRQGNTSVFSSLLQAKLRQNLAAGKQSMLFLNRRGFESFVSCRHCGYVVECPHCSVAMAYHQGESLLKCHYCGQTAPIPQACPSCGSKAIRYFGAGTQKIAEAAQRLLPQARVARIDRDSVSQRGSYERLYQAMLAGEIDILVGTQMIAKGLDFPNVTLVGVVAADTTLNLPDYRSGERTFQLITQVAGRAGRHQAGEVVVQTYHPESKILQAIQRQDYGDFYQRELQQRRFANYPPFSSLIRLVVSGTDQALVHQQARDLAYYIGEELGALNEPPEAEPWQKPLFWGPKPCPKERIKDRWRLQIVVKGPALEEIRQVVKQASVLWEQKRKASKEVQLAIDVEPLNMI